MLFEGGCLCGETTYIAKLLGTLNEEYPTPGNLDDRVIIPE